ncbi:MAG: molybdopterin-dependent oxidoreductase [Chloroflexi bacterium]|nr:molybdopterin-dependent oxidoreductase [Chloroflexota bacterium]
MPRASAPLVPAARHPLWSGFLIGLLVGAATAALMVALRLALDAPSLQEVLMERLVALTPGPVFGFLIDAFQKLGKPLLFFSLSLAVALAGGLAGSAYAWSLLRLAPPYPRPTYLYGLLLGLALWSLSALAVAPLAGIGPFGVGLPGSALAFSLSQALAWGFFGVAVAALVEEAVLAGPSVEPASRRRFLRQAALWGAVVGVAALGLRALVRVGEKMGANFIPTRQPGVLPPVVTPNPQFYIISKNAVDPVVEVEAWKLKIGGLVERPYTLTYPELRALPLVEEYVTLECISNLVGGDLISNALWKGVPLKHLLERAGLKPAAEMITFVSQDGYSESLPVDQALRDEVLVAYEMNGEPLPTAHGFPARIIVPGLYGMKHPKWLTHIDVVAYEFQGFWEQQGWSDEAEVKTTSQLLVPRHLGEVSRVLVQTAGIAFAGAKGITRVEVSFDNGETWRDAALQPALSPYTWVLWTADWQPAASGEHTLVVRATDGQGAVQTSEEAPTFPDGAAGLHRIKVTFRPTGAQGPSRP